MSQVEKAHRTELILFLANGLFKHLHMVLWPRSSLISIDGLLPWGKFSISNDHTKLDVKTNISSHTWIALTKFWRNVLKKPFMCDVDTKGAHPNLISLPLKELTNDFKTVPLAPPPAPPIIPSVGEHATLVNPRDQLNLIESRHLFYLIFPFLPRSQGIFYCTILYINGQDPFTIPWLLVIF